MAFSEPYGINSVIVGTTELSIVSGTTTLQTITTDGIYQLWVDPFNMAKGDRFIFKVYEKVRSAGTKRLVFDITLSDAQARALVVPNLILFHGWDMTITKVSGTDRAFDASIRKVA